MEEKTQIKTLKMKTYHFNTLLTEGKFKDNPKTVQEAFESDNKIIFSLIKKYGYSFDDEVLEAAHIKKIVRDHSTNSILVDHDPVKPMNKKLKKDKKSIDEILDELCDEHINIKEDFDLPIASEDINNIEMPIDPEI